MKINHQDVQAANEPRPASRRSRTNRAAQYAASRLPDANLLKLGSEIGSLQQELTTNQANYERLLATYDATLPEVPAALSFTERDAALFFLSGCSVGDCLAESCDFVAEFKVRGYRKCMGVNGGIEWVVDAEAQLRGDEILAADRAWRETQNRHSRSIGLMANCDQADEIIHKIARLSTRIARDRATTIVGLQVKARAIVDNPDSDSIRDSIIDDLVAMSTAPNQ